MLKKSLSRNGEGFTKPTAYLSTIIE